MSLLKRIIDIIPKGFLWRLTVLNTLIIIASIIFSSWMIYHVACFLVEGIGNFDQQRQQQFNATLFQYMWVFSLIGIVAGGMLHFYLTRKLVHPIRKLIFSTKQLQNGTYPEPIQIPYKDDEISELIYQYNQLIQQLQANEQERHRLVTDLSHEIRTPVSNINGYLHALKSGMIKGNKDLFRDLHEEANRLSELIDQISLLKEWNDTSKQNFVRKEIINIYELIHQSVNLFRWKLKQANIPIELDVQPMKGCIYKEGFQQILHNLLDNAIQYYEGSGSIMIAGKAVEKNKYHIRVSGPSQPIPKEAENKVFERFYRIESSRNRLNGGSGLGLAIVKDIVEQHNGKVGVKSEEGITTFWVCISLH